MAGVEIVNFATDVERSKMKKTNWLTHVNVSQLQRGYYIILVGNLVVIHVFLWNVLNAMQFENALNTIRALTQKSPVRKLDIPYVLFAKSSYVENVTNILPNIAKILV